jgi:hypothetical protein
MDDQKFINVYVENAVGTVHEYINVILQLKTKLQIASDLVQEKEQIIGQLRSNLEDSRKSDDEISEAYRNAKSWEEQFNAMKSKVSHMDTLTNQYNDIKKQFIEKKQENQKLREQILKTKEKPKTSVKKAINTKNIVKEVAVEPEEKIDDF